VCALILAVSGWLPGPATAQAASQAASTVAPQTAMRPLRISSNHRFFERADGTPFFWLGDTAWLLFTRLDRADATRYLDDRQAKGFNVVQVMVLHGADDVNAYGAAALIDQDPARPRVTPGQDIAKEGEYDYWDHVDWIVDRAAERGLYVAMVAAWGSNARSGRLNEQNVEAYTRFLAGRYKDRPNIIWVTGGDTQGDRESAVWRAMGRTFKAEDPNHLVTFHPFGRTQSSTWFHAEAWLDFNMFQSGHRRYDQDDEPGAKGEDNWRYVAEDYAKTPVKPTLDGEPSYEGIPQGLHDPKEPFWTDADARRYAWWSVFAGAAGHTYGHSAVMQMHKPAFGAGAYGVRQVWDEAIQAPGAGQMRHLATLMLSRPYFERVPDQGAIAGDSVAGGGAAGAGAAGGAARYDRVIVTRGKRYLFAYTYTGRPFTLKMGVITGARLRASWYDPRTGAGRAIGVVSNEGEHRFDPPGTPAPGNDWVLVLDDAAAGYAAPGATVPAPTSASASAAAPASVTADAATEYLFASFRGNGEDGLHLAHSRDGLRWTALNDDRSFLQPAIGTKLMRDPSIARGPDGVFHLVWTTGWWDRGIGVAHSTDLIHWSEQTFLPVMEQEPGAVNCWAPELFYDEATRTFLIFWSTTIAGRFPETAETGDAGNARKLNHRMYVVTTKDFKTYSGTRLFYDGGFNVIDGTLVKDGARYVLIVKDETLRPVPKKHLRTAVSDRAEGPYGPASAPITPDWVEGPSPLKVGDAWIVYFDEYTRKKYGAIRSTDLTTWTNISDRIEFPSGTRHGTAFAVPSSIVAPLLAHEAR
jgi:hypothetical protein